MSRTNTSARIQTDAVLCQAPAVSPKTKRSKPEGNQKNLGSMLSPLESIVEAHRTHYATSIIEKYRMNHRYRGIAIIFDHYEYDDGTEKRDPPEVDASRLKNILEKYGFWVVIKTDLKCEKLIHTIEEAASDDYSDCDCILIAVMTHGSKTKLSAYDKKYKIDKLWEPFGKCATLAGKPKIFIVQACRGRKTDSGGPIRIDSYDEPLSPTIPRMADILVIYSSFQGYVSHRHEETGTWFIQCICKLLEENNDKSMDFLQVLTLLNCRMASDSTFRGDKHQKQVACFMSSLTRQLYIHKVSFT